MAQTPNETKPDAEPATATRTRRTGMPSRFLHLTIRTNSGSCEHFYHFMLGYLLPLATYLARRGIADNWSIALRSCGPLDRILRELDLPGLLLCERFTHAAFKEIVACAPWAAIDEIRGFDFGHLPAERVLYDVAGIKTGTDFLRRRLASAVDTATARIDAAWSGRPRVLMIERGESDPFYQSSLAELKTSANQRRSIGNHTELAAAMAAAFPGFRNLQIETTSLAEQVAWFGLTDILVAQHGAALSNILWMRRGSHVIEIVPDVGTNHRDLFSQLAKVCGLPYSRFRQSAGPFGPVPVQDLAALIATSAAFVKDSRPIAGT